MKMKPELTEYIRTMLRGDYEENDRIEAKLDAEGWDDFQVLLGIVFYLAVHRRLAKTATSSDIIGFVAEMRAAAPEDAPELDANAAEQLVRAALDPRTDIEIDPEMAGAIQGLVIMHILGGQQVSEQDLDALLAEAVQVAERH